MFSAVLIKFWLDYKNDWLTVAAYAEHNGMTIQNTQECIDAGREYATVYKWSLDDKGNVFINGVA